MRVLYEINMDEHTCIVHETTNGRNDLMSLRELISSVYAVKDRVVGLDYDEEAFSLLTLCSIGEDLTGRVVKHINIPILRGVDYFDKTQFYLNMLSAGKERINLAEGENPIMIYWVFAVTGEPFEGIMLITEDEKYYHQYDYDLVTKECYFSGSIDKGKEREINLSTRRGILMKGEH